MNRKWFVFVSCIVAGVLALSATTAFAGGRGGGHAGFNGGARAFSGGARSFHGGGTRAFQGRSYSGVRPTATATTATRSTAPRQFLRQRFNGGPREFAGRRGNGSGTHRWAGNDWRHHHHRHHYHPRYYSSFYYPYYDPFYSGWYGSPYYYSGVSASYDSDGSEYRYNGGGGDLAVQVQQRLSQEGYYDGPIDGVIGSGTRRAIRSFERRHGLPVDGRVDGELLNRMGLS